MKAVDYCPQYSTCLTSLMKMFLFFFTGKSYSHWAEENSSSSLSTSLARLEVISVEDWCSHIDTLRDQLTMAFQKLQKNDS